MKRVLMVIPFFPPMGGGGVYRPLSFVRYLPANGWRVTVIAPRGDAFWIRDESLLERIPADTRVIRTETWSGQAVLRRGGAVRQSRSSQGFGALRRLGATVMMPDTYVGWYPFALRAAMRELRGGGYDAIYSTSPPESAHLVGATLHRRTRLPWVADFRDPWMNLHLMDVPSPLHAAFHRRLERMVCRQAELVATTAWSERLLRCAWQAARVTRISNGYDGEEMAAVASVQPPAGGPMRIVHAGMLTLRRSAVPFLEALRALQDRRPDARGNIDVEFAGAREDENDRAAARLGLTDCVRFVDTVAHTDMLRRERAAHILLLIKHADPRYNGLVPGKLYEYIGLRRPVLALVPPGEALELVRSLRRGETVDPADAAAISRVLEHLYDLHRAGGLDAAFDLSEQPQLERSRLAARLGAVLDRATEGGGA
ncbi:MAG TPA: glycosyltransferase [Candidatus Krumholzibacteria bacterium]|nr:glycosyltransferase [Candidatus Krumholzibacteria bacterium]